jgi:hypothetical protein
MDEPKLGLEEIITKLQSQMPQLIALLRGLQPENRPVQNIDALIVLKSGMGLLMDLLMTADQKELMALIERSQLDNTVECLAVYGAMEIIYKHRVAGAREW